MNADNRGREQYCNAREQCRPRTNFIKNFQADLCQLTISGAKIFVYPNEEGQLSQTQCGSTNGVQPNNGNNGYPMYHHNPLPDQSHMIYSSIVISRNTMFQSRLSPPGGCSHIVKISCKTMFQSQLYRLDGCSHIVRHMLKLYITYLIVDNVGNRETLNDNWLQDLSLGIKKDDCSGTNRPQNNRETLPNQWMSSNDRLHNKRETVPNHWMSGNSE
uniref:Uncharacterized protein n=1 Tax=Romanomermis culicivorax TaxID=13658 RepID=A0A915JW06_ROMCU